MPWKDRLPNLSPLLPLLQPPVHLEWRCILAAWLHLPTLPVPRTSESSTPTIVALRSDLAPNEGPLHLGM